jgi:hypothetical protein
MTDRPPRIETREDLEQYIGHLNAKRYQQQIAYYDPEVLYKVGSLTLTNPQQIADFYADFHGSVKERVQLLELAINANTVAAVLHAVFEPFKSYLHNGLTFKAGVTTEIVSFVFYKLREGRIHRIHMTRYPGPASDFAS